jgi:hypothetical protein
VLRTGPRLGEDGDDVLQRLPHLAAKSSVSKRCSPFQPTCPPTKTSRPRADTPLA